MKIEPGRGMMPCPFCGQRLTEKFIRYSEPVFEVVCKNQDCQASGPWSETAEGAKTKWNRQKATLTNIKDM